MYFKQKKIISFIVIALIVYVRNKKWKQKIMYLDVEQFWEEIWENNGRWCEPFFEQTTYTKSS